MSAEIQGLKIVPSFQLYYRCTAGRAIVAKLAVEGRVGDRNVIDQILGRTKRPLSGIRLAVGRNKLYL